MSELTYAQAVNKAVHNAMTADNKVMFFGLGADDPKRMFGTSEGLVEAFGNERVFDMPTSENAMTGVGVGLAIQGYRPIMTHLRLDFFLLAMDQLVNSAAKWHFMFGGQDSVPLVIRLVLGRGWGQGPTHSQNLHSWFCHIPGLKVVMPTTPNDAHGLLLSSIKDNNPVVFLEHRWLHNQTGPVQLGEPIELGQAKVIREGQDVTIVSTSYMTVEALRAADLMEKNGIHCEIVDLRTLSPLDWPTIFKSLRKTGRLLALDTAAQSFGVASEIVSRCSIECFDALTTAPKRLASPDCPVPTSFGLSDQFYPESKEIIEAVGQLVEKDLSSIAIPESQTPHDVPGEWFKGPF